MTSPFSALDAKRIGGVGVAALVFAVALVGLPDSIDPFDQHRLASSCEAGTSQRIETPNHKPEDVDVGNGWVVWHDVVKPADNRLEFEADVYAYNLTRGERIAVATEPAMETVAFVEEEVVIWRHRDVDARHYEIRAEDLATGEEWTLDLPAQGALNPYGFSGDRALVLHERQNATRLFVVNVENDTTRTVLGHDPGPPELWQNRVVWVNRTEHNNTTQDRLMTLNVTTDRRTVHYAPKNDSLARPDIWGNRLVFEPGEKGGSGWDLWGFDLETDPPVPIVSDELDDRTGQVNPAVSSEAVVFRSFVPGGSEDRIRVHVFGSGRNLTLSDGIGTKPDVWKNIAAWAEQDPNTLESFVAVECLPLEQPRALTTGPLTIGGGAMPGTVRSLRQLA